MESALLAALLGALAAPSKLFVLACVLYLPVAALVIGGPTAELRPLATLGWPWSQLAGAVLAEYAMIGVVAAIVAAPLAALPGGFGDEAGAGTGAAAAIALVATLAAGAVRAAMAAELVPNAERSRSS